MDIKQYLANKRQGTHKSKERNEVAGSTRKIKKQKGTGTARAGSVKSPVFVGGGRIFGPRPKDYTQKLNKKVKRLARRSILSQKAQQGAIIVVEDFNLDAPKTKDFVAITKNLNVDGKKTLMVLPIENKNIYLSARNLEKAEVIGAASLNAYKVLNADVLVVAESSLAKIEETLNK